MAIGDPIHNRWQFTLRGLILAVIGCGFASLVLRWAIHGNLVAAFVLSFLGGIAFVTGLLVALRGRTLGAAVWGALQGGAAGGAAYQFLTAAMQMRVDSLVMLIQNPIEIPFYAACTAVAGGILGLFLCPLVVAIVLK